MYIVGEILAVDRNFLEKEGITHVVCCIPLEEGMAEDRKKWYEESLKIKFLPIPMLDSDRPTDPETLKGYISSACDFMEEALRSPRAKVLVHCQAGISRSTAIVQIFLMKMGLSEEDSLASIKTAREKAKPNFDILKAAESMRIIGEIKRPF